MNLRGLGRSGAISDALKHLRAQEAHTQGMAMNQQLMKKNKQMMETRDLQNQAIKNRLMAERKEMERRDQVLPVQDVMQKIPTGENRQMLGQMLVQSGMIKDGTVKTGYLEDMREKIRKDPSLSIKWAQNQVEHYKNIRDKMEAQLKDPEAKIPDKERQELEMQSKQAEKAYYAALNGNEKLQKAWKDRTEANRATMGNMPKEWQRILMEVTGGKVPQFMKRWQNPKDVKAIRLTQALYQKYRKEQAEQKRYGGMSPKEKERAKLGDAILSIKRQIEGIRARERIAGHIIRPGEQAAIDKLNEYVTQMEQRYKDLGGVSGSIGGLNAEDKNRPSGEKPGLDKAVEDEINKYI